MLLILDRIVFIDFASPYAVYILLTLESLVGQSPALGLNLLNEKHFIP